MASDIKTADPVVTTQEENRKIEIREHEDVVYTETEKKLANSDDIDLDTVIEEYRQTKKASGESKAYNIDKIRLGIPLSEADELREYAERAITKAAAQGTSEFAKQLEDYTSEYHAIRDAGNYYAASNDQLKKSISKSNTDQLVNEIPTIKEGVASVGAKHIEAGRQHKTFSGDEAYRVFATLGSGVRKVTLWNSGITLTLKNIPLRILDQYLELANHDNYEYGKEYGAFYYLFAGLLLDQNIADKILPAAIIGSNYRDWADTNKLLAQISLQDYHVILWALACLMYPTGTTVNYVCGEPSCGHIHTEKVDLGKLKLMNRELINDEMIDYFRKGNWVNEQDIENYRNMAKLEDKIEFDISDVEGENKHYIFHLKQCSVAEHLAVGKAYNAELRKQAEATDRDAVVGYIQYNQNRCYRPWIKSVEIIYSVDDTIVSTFAVDNDMAGANLDTIDLILDETQQRMPDFTKKIQDYIDRTKICHIAFYFQECPACHAKPAMSHNGYIPYDMTQAFFTLGRMKLWKISYQQRDEKDSKTTS